MEDFGLHIGDRGLCVWRGAIGTDEWLGNRRWGDIGRTPEAVRVGSAGVEGTRRERGVQEK